MISFELIYNIKSYQKYSLQLKLYYIIVIIVRLLKYLGLQYPSDPA